MAKLLARYQSRVADGESFALENRVLKAFSDRKRDWLDIEGVIVRQGDTLDWSYVDEHLSPLCELNESPHILKQLEELKSIH